MEILHKDEVVMIILVVLTLASYLIHLYLTQRQINYLRQQSPIPFPSITRTKVANVAWATNCIAIIILLLSAKYCQPNGFMVLSVISFYTIFEIFKFINFIIDRHYQLSQSPISTFLFALIKRLITVLILSCIIISLINYLYQQNYNLALISWFIVIVTYLLYLLTEGYLIRLFYEIRPWHEKQYVNEINDQIKPFSLTVTAIEIFNESKRSSRGNAYITGFGRFKKIFLADTLLAKIGYKELIAVILHELGHHYYHHLIKLVVIFTMIVTLYFAVLYFILENVYQWYYFLLFVPVLYFYCLPIKNYLSRKFEFQADHFSKLCQYGESLKEVLARLARMNQLPSSGDKWFITWFYSHPAINERINVL